MMAKDKPKPARPNQHVHRTTDFLREYQKFIGTEVVGVNSRGRKVTRQVHRRTMVWGCSCGSGPTTETS